jgi:hypothetical protein
MENRMNRDCGERSHAGFVHILPFLAIPLAFGLMRGMAHHRFSHMGEHRHEAWKHGVPPMFAEMHRRAHAAEAAEAAAAEKPAETEA